VRPLRSTSPDLRRAIVVLNRRQVAEADEWSFLRSVPNGEALLLRLVSDDLVADLPRSNALWLLAKLQFRGVSEEDLRARNRDAMLALVLQLLSSSRPRVREAAVAVAVYLLRVSPHTASQPFRQASTRLVDALRAAIKAGGLRAQTCDYLDAVLPKLSPDGGA
jgi:hypothetical protein